MASMSIVPFPVRKALLLASALAVVGPGCKSHYEVARPRDEFRNTRPYAPAYAPRVYTTEEYQALFDLYRNEVNQYDRLSDQYERLVRGVHVIGDTIRLCYRLLDGTPYETHFTASQLRYWQGEGQKHRDLIGDYSKGVGPKTLRNRYGTRRMEHFVYDGQFWPLIPFSDPTSSKILHEKNYTAFINTDSVRDFAQSIRAHSSGDLDFIYNVISVKCQLTSYTHELLDQPRFPLETLLGGGGDCAASCQLLASLYKAAHPEWGIELVLLQPVKKIHPNDTGHVRLVVDDRRGHRTLIEATSNTLGGSFPASETADIYPPMYVSARIVF